MDIHSLWQARCSCIVSFFHGKLVKVLQHILQKLFSNREPLSLQHLAVKSLLSGGERPALGVCEIGSRHISGLARPYCDWRHVM